MTSGAGSVEKLPVAVERKLRSALPLAKFSPLFTLATSDVIDVSDSDISLLLILSKLRKSEV